MCGIFGYVGRNNSIEKCLQGLKSLEYRGYDSAGIAGIDSGNLICYKEKGNLSELEKQLGKKIHNFQSSIGHTRWATHGGASKRNAHPHLDQKKEIAVVHNGILENHRSLRSMLESKGMIFESETDTEVIAQLISYFYKGNLIKAIREALELMKGFWGLAIIHKDHPDQIVATSCENPIVIGISSKNKEAFVSSDPYAFSERGLDLYYLNNFEIALVTHGKIQVFDQNERIIEKTPEYLDLPAVSSGKDDFEHFMLKEIFEQPRAIQNSLENRFDIKKGEVKFENFSLNKEEFQRIKQIVILGCGTSWHAGLIAAQQFEEFIGIPCHAEVASEYRYRKVKANPHTLVIAISQSGETFDTIAAAKKVKEEQAKLIAICNVPGSTLTRIADHTILLKAGPELSVCSTKAFSCQLSVLSLLVTMFGGLHSLSKEKVSKLLSEIDRLPALAETILEQKDKIATLAKKYSVFPNFFFLGRQYMVPTCFEAALKLKEISYINANGYPAGELKHGPIALIDSSSAVIGLCGNNHTNEKMLSNLTEVKSRGGKILAIAPLGTKEIEHIADDILWIPDIEDPFAPLAYSIATQVFAYYIAKEKGTEIDKPRNLAKSVTVE